MRPDDELARTDPEHVMPRLFAGVIVLVAIGAIVGPAYILVTQGIGPILDFLVVPAGVVGTFLVLYAIGSIVVFALKARGIYE